MHSWLRPDLGSRSGMTVLVMEIPTGHEVGRDAIEAVYAANVSGIRRVRFRPADQELIIFYEYVSFEASPELRCYCIIYLMLNQAVG